MVMKTVSTSFLAWPDHIWFLSHRLRSMVLDWILMDLALQGISSPSLWLCGLCSLFFFFFFFCLFGGNSHLVEPDDIVMHAFLMNSLLLKIFRATKNLVENGDDIMSWSKQLVYYWFSFVIKWALVLSWYLCWHSGAIPRTPGTVIKLHCKHACNISATVSTVVYESVETSAMSTPLPWQWH